MKSVGLDIHIRGVRAVETTGRGKSLRITRYVDYPVRAVGGAPDPDELRDALNEIFKTTKLSKSHVICAVEAGETVVREIPVPFTADDQIRKVVKYEAEHHLHDCDADDVIVQYTKVSESAEGSNLLVFAARKEEISRRIEYARAAGVEPLAMDLDAIAFFNAVTASGLLEENPSCVLLNITHRSTEMIMVEGGRVRALRSVRMGVDSITQGLARDMDIDFADAESRLDALARQDEGDVLFVGAGDAGDEKRETEKSHAELERDLFKQKRSELVARLKREFVRSTAVLKGKSRPELVIASGEGVAVPELIDELGGRLGIEVKVFRPSEQIAHKLGKEDREKLDAGGAVALGLALKGTGLDPVGLDFRQEELKVANKFELLKGPMALTVSLLFLTLMVGSFLFLHIKDSYLENRLRGVWTSAYQSFNNVAVLYNETNPFIVRGKPENVNPAKVEGTGAERLRSFNRELRRMLRKLEREYGGGDEVAPVISALSVWNDVFKVIRDHHKEIKYIDFKSLDIVSSTPRRVTMKIVVADASSVTVFVNELKNVPSLKGLDVEPWQFQPMEGLPYQETRVEFKEKKRRGKRR
jgi:type IV pilus assembly protein PilM